MSSLEYNEKISGRFLRHEARRERVSTPNETFLRISRYMTFLRISRYIYSDMKV